MKEKQHFERVMKELESIIGKDAAARAFLMYAKITEWCIDEGHGDIYLSALNHRFGKKFNTKTVHNIEEKKIKISGTSPRKRNT